MCLLLSSGNSTQGHVKVPLKHPQDTLTLGRWHWGLCLPPFSLQKITERHSLLSLVSPQSVFSETGKLRMPLVLLSGGCGCLGAAEGDCCQ